MFRDFAHQPGPIHILVENGVITLAGKVKSLQESNSLENLVRYDTGAVSVVNDLEVKEKGPAPQP
jgi:osmotically-inducible protein OsmY